MSEQAATEAVARLILMPDADGEYPAVHEWAPDQALPGEFLLRDGTPAMIWPLLPTDAETLRDMFRRLSPDSRRRRFLQVLNQLDGPMIGLLVESVDGVHHIALLLIALPPGGKEEPIAVARLLQYSDDPATADIAVTVVDDWQGQGVGGVLVSALMERRPAAVRRLRTIVLADNRASLALLARTGRMSSGLPERGVLDVTVELPTPSQAHSAWPKVVDLWAQGAWKFVDQSYLLAWLPSADLFPAVDGYLGFVQRLVGINHDLTVKWVEAATARFGVPCEQVAA
jgi:RimJ/RimL family protein N-acetyltransferase